MPTECNAMLFEFAPVEGRQVVAAFDGGAITSDAGALLLGETDRVIRLTDRFASCFSDMRMAELVETYGDFPLGLVDASVIAVAERLNADAVATLDHRHFSVVRPRHLPAFKLLPEASD